MNSRDPFAGEIRREIDCGPLTDEEIGAGSVALFQMLDKEETTMITNQIRQLIRARPFASFRIVMANDAFHNVTDPDAAALTDNLVVVLSGQSFVMLPASQIAEVKPLWPPPAQKATELPDDDAVARNLEELRRRASAQPFVPFGFTTSNGHPFNVLSPEALVMNWDDPKDTIGLVEGDASHLISPRYLTSVGELHGPKPPNPAAILRLKETFGY